MIYELALFAIALIGSTAGGWIDLKTTEIPDIVPASMAALGLLAHIINAASTGIWTNVYYSFAVGFAYLILGYILFYTGQWGEADVLLLAAVGVVLPQMLPFFNSNFIVPYPAVFLLNTFIIGGIYSLVYSVVLALKNPAVFPAFFQELKAGPQKTEAVIMGAMLLLYLGAIKALELLVPANVQLVNRNIFYSTAIFLPALLLVYVFYKFARAIDMTAFRKKIRAKDLKEGDVLAEDVGGLKSNLYVGLEAVQIKELKKLKKDVWIKEGIRYGPTFFLAIVATWLWGNLLAVIIGVI